MNKIVRGKEAQDAHQTYITGLLQEFRLQLPNLAHKCKTSHGHSTISPGSHKGNEFLLYIIQIARQASMVPYNNLQYRDLEDSWCLEERHATCEQTEH
jgi:hypothetical protein